MAKTAIKSIQRKVQDNIQRVRDRIAQACGRANRDPASVRLVAVTKSVDVEVIRILIEAGLVDLGESRVQQLAQRAAMIAETQKRRRILDGQRDAVAPVWHMIGHLQRNKVRAATQWATVFHSVDSLRLAEEISSEAGKRNQVADVLLQVNVAGEKSKHGIAVGAIEVFCEQIGALAGMRLIGLMGMMPLVDDPEEVRPLFRRLREIAEDLVTQECVSLERCELSMGMSNDFEVAIEEGATMVRVGTALFEGLSTAKT